MATNNPYSFYSSGSPIEAIEEVNAVLARSARMLNQMCHLKPDESVNRQKFADIKAANVKLQKLIEEQSNTLEETSNYSPRI